MSDGWIEHKGGPMPCDGLQLVEVRSTHGAEYRDHACRFTWDTKNTSWFITHWRPVGKTQHKKSDETNQVLQHLHDQIAERMRKLDRKANRTKEDGFAIAYRGQVLGLLDALNMVEDAMKEHGNGER